MTQAPATTTPKPVDIFSIRGLLEILGENIDSVRADSSDENIKKSNAILQNVNAIKGIYTLAYDRERLENIKRIDETRAFEPDHYIKPTTLLGSVLGDDTERLKRDHELDQQSKRRDFDGAIEKLRQEVENNKDNQEASQDDYQYEHFSNSDIEIFNSILCNAPEKVDLSTEYKKDLYLLEQLKPSHFGVEE